MPFENFYEESDKARRWWKCVGAAFLLLVGYWTFALLAIPDQNAHVPPPEKSFLAQQTDSATLRASRLERVISLCQNFPKPELFFWENQLLNIHNDDLTIFSETYKSSRPSTEIMPFFQVWFSSNGWIRRERKPDERWATTSAAVTTFVKGNQEISVASSDWTGFHTIECQERDVMPLSE